ncbi:hypothetical protein [Polaribacter uvawellassae]|uniref:hypothetical protein n=1 Tax=Polaribacter uvawellassae TaxID=3133495 RepID=UPI00321A4AD8
MCTTYSQENNNYILNIKSKDSIENNSIKSIVYKNIFNKKENLYKTKDSVLNILKEKGYYTLLIDSVNQQKKKYTYYLRLGTKIKDIYIKVQPKDAEIFIALNLKTKNEFLILESEKLKPLLNTINKYLIENGLLFSKVKLINANIKNQSLYTELQISYSKKRSINKTILNGYIDFPSSFVNHYLKLNNKILITENKIEDISKKINRLHFASEIKKPEILFSKDSTILYLYLKKKNANSFDGLINFSTENKKLNFRGYLDLNLVNIFNKGEEIKINWKNNSNKKQDFTLSTKVPYIFNSKISTEASFNLFRNDSTYINTNSKISLNYPLNQFIDISILFSAENSTINFTSNNISNFDKKMFGFGVYYNSHKNSEFNLNFNILFGTRRTNTKNNQLLLNLTSSGIIKTSNKTAIYIRSKSGFLFSSFYLNNELFREGGTNSIRGFNAQSIFSSKFSYLNSELRFLSNNNSYLYSIHDVGFFNLNTRNSVLYSLGFGYNFIKNNNSIDISYIYGNSTEAISSLNSSILSIKLITLF